MASDTPNVPGLYFATHRPTGKREPYWLQCYGGLFRVEMFGRDTDYEPSDFTDWSGPLVDPMRKDEPR